MKYEATNIEDYIAQLPEDRKAAVSKLRNVLKTNLPEGFTEVINYDMPSFVVSHNVYPGGYHCDPKLPLPFISYASQKNYVALYHMGIYANEDLLNWFKNEYPKHSKYKLDMGKSCIRFKRMDDIPYDLIAELATKMTVDDWINLYDQNVKQRDVKKI